MADSWKPGPCASCKIAWYCSRSYGSDKFPPCRPSAPKEEGANSAVVQDVAAAQAHGGCHSAEHNPQKGMLHGYCVVCGVPWPCDTAKYFLRPRPSGEE